jgi:hypothetical protein
MASSEAFSSKSVGPEYEEQHVHEVYEQIASHFSNTRYKVDFSTAKEWNKWISDQSRSSHGL